MNLSEQATRSLQQHLVRTHQLCKQAKDEKVDGLFMTDRFANEEMKRIEDLYVELFGDHADPFTEDDDEDDEDEPELSVCDACGEPMTKIFSNYCGACLEDDLEDENEED